LGAAYLGAAWLVGTDAAERIGERAWLWRDGVETPLPLRAASAGSEREAALPTSVHRAARAYPGAVHLPFFARATDAPRRLYRLRDAGPYHEATVRLRPVPPGLAPVDTQYEWTTGPGQGRGLFAGRHLAAHTLDHRAGERLYRRYYLADPAVRPERRGRSTHLGAVRLGLPAHRAELTLDLAARAPRGAAYCGAAGGRFACRGDAAERIRRAREALGSMRAARDRIALRTRRRRAPTAGDRIIEGTLLAGQFIPETTP
jgi:hypothetical protein